MNRNELLGDKTNLAKKLHETKDFKTGRRGVERPTSITSFSDVRRLGTGDSRRYIIKKGGPDKDYDGTYEGRGSGIEAMDQDNGLFDEYN